MPAVCSCGRRVAWDKMHRRMPTWMYEMKILMMVLLLARLGRLHARTQAGTATRRGHQYSRSWQRLGHQGE